MKIPNVLKLLTINIIFLISFFNSPDTVFAWFSNPYPSPEGTINCQYEYTLLPSEIDLKIISGSTQQIIWLSVENNTNIAANWQFLDPNQSWPTDYPWVPNRDAETFAVKSSYDSVGFQNGGTGPWVRQIIPDGIYRLYFTGTLGVEDIKVTFQNLDLSWSKPCSFVSIPLPSKPQLTVIKQIVNDDGGTAKAENFTISVSGTNVSTPTFTASESGTVVNLDAGSYSVTENAPEGYTTTTEGDCSGTVTDGDTKVCTIINNDIAPTITLTKKVINDNGGTLEPDDFGISVGGNVVTSGVETKVRANEPIAINENSVDGYNFVSIEGNGCPSSLGESVTLLPGQDINCIITNDDIAPRPVSKVVVIPGLGASWNVDALINCKNSGYSGGWTLAPYAKDIYNPLLLTLPTQGWTPVPFYYDWRKDIRDNASKLNDLINSSVSGDEKINLVGHSMGGLIGRNYLESQSGGKALKFLAVGTPNQGSAFAYPALINNEVWTNDLVQKIAATLLLNHCGAPTSLKNLLPTYDYLRDNKTKQLIAISNMKTRNNYLPSNFVAPFWDVKVGTLAGTNNPTLKIIDVVRDFRWPDGRPVGREYSDSGDGTVLVESAQIPNAFSNEVINQSHAGIIASDEGVDKILRFFGSPGINDPPYTEHKSALILVGYPGSFSITDKDNNVFNSEDGMIAIMDPTSGDYQLQINPTSNTTTFVVGQFLANGKSEYNEYKIKGLTQEPKIIEFNAKSINKNPLREIRDYRYPHFPKFWFNFWKFWSKFHK